MRFTSLVSFWSFVSVATAQFSGPNGRCPSIQLYVLEQQGSSNLLSIAVTILDIAAGVNITSLSYAPSSDLASSVAQGVASLTSELNAFSQKCPNGKLVLLGDAQGASYVSATLAGTNLGGNSITAISSSVGSQIAAVVLYRDVTQAAEQGRQAACPACTAGGSLARTGAYIDALQPFTDRLQTWCNANDGSCCASGSTQVSVGSYFTEANRAYAVYFISENLGAQNSAAGFGPQYFPSTCAVAPPTTQKSTVSTASPTSSPAVITLYPATTTSAKATTPDVIIATATATGSVELTTPSVPTLTLATYQIAPKPDHKTASSLSSSAKASAGASSAAASSFPPIAQASPAADKTSIGPQVSRGTGERLHPSAVLALAAFGIAGSIMTLMM